MFRYVFYVWMGPDLNILNREGYLRCSCDSKTDLAFPG
jgi:hypothetical protein